MRPGIVAAIAWVLVVLVIYGDIGYVVFRMIKNIGDLFTFLSLGEEFGIIAFLSLGIVFVCMFALTTVAAWLLPRIPVQYCKILAGITGIFAVITAILTFVTGIIAEFLTARHAVFAVLLCGAGVVLVINAISAFTALPALPATLNTALPAMVAVLREPVETGKMGIKLVWWMWVLCAMLVISRPIMGLLGVVGLLIAANYKQIRDLINQR
jgi:hypothetical protein